MSAVILNGKEVAKALQETLSAQVAEEGKRLGQSLKLDLVQFGAIADAELYAKAIERIMGKVGIQLEHHQFDAKIEHDEAHNKIRDLGQNGQSTGILILSPLPKQLSHKDLVREVPARKDVESTPPTALAILELILSTKIPIEGKEAVVVGRSNIVGKPIAGFLLDRHATVTICHSRTKDLRKHIERADIVVAAAGKSRLIQGQWIKQGAIVIDAGENWNNGKVTGDVDFDKASRRAGFISPVPNGVGPVTTWMLVKNLISLSKQQR